MGNTARRSQQRAAKIVEEAQAAKHLHARQMNGTSGSNSTSKRFYSNATARECYLSIIGSWVLDFADSL